MAKNPRSLAHRARVIDAGGERVSFLMKSDDSERLNRLAKTHGGKTAAILAGLRALDQEGRITKQDVIAWIDSNTV